MDFTLSTYEPPPPSVFPATRSGHRPKSVGHGEEFTTPSELLGDTCGIGQALRLRSLRSGSALMRAPSVEGGVSRSMAVAVRAAEALPHSSLVRLLEASRVVCAEIRPTLTIGFILSETQKLLQCDLCVLYMHNDKGSPSTLIPLVAEKIEQDSSNEMFRLHHKETSETTSDRSEIAIECFKEGRTIQRNFIDEEGELTPGEVVSVLCTPVWDSMDKVRAILKCVNQVQKDSSFNRFTESDELILEHFSLLAGVALRNAALYKDAVTSRDLADGLLTLLSSLRSDLGIQSAILTLTTHARKIVQVEHCTVYLVDRASSHLLSMSSDYLDEAPMRIPFNINEDPGLLGQCARSGEVVISEENEQRTPGTGPPTETLASLSLSSAPRKDIPEYQGNVCVVPVKSDKGETIGLIQLTNKQDDEGFYLPFKDEDIRVLQTFGRLVGPKLEKSGLGLKATAIVPTEAGKASDSLCALLERSRRPSLGPPSIKEEDEEDILLGKRESPLNPLCQKSSSSPATPKIGSSPSLFFNGTRDSSSRSSRHRPSPSAQGDTGLLELVKETEGCCPPYSID